MDDKDSPARRDAWSAYWAAGALHSCVGSYAGNYEGAIGAFWQRVFGQLPEGPLRLLDLATGNGAIPQLAWRSLGGREGLEVDAVDLAELRPDWMEPGAYPGLRFHPGVAMEALPFPDARFDLACSQFGFEYAARGPALAELLRVLKPDGRLALAMHHAGSVLAEVALAESQHQAALLAPEGLLAAAEAVVPWFALARRGGNPGQHPEAVLAREAYNRAVATLSERAQAARAPDLLHETQSRVSRLLAGVGLDPVPSLARLQALRHELELATLRSRELLDSALDEAALAALVAAIEQARPGAKVEVAPLAQAEGVLAWGLRLLPA